MASEGRVIGRPFKPGKSGNPGGRPKEDPVVKEMLIAACPEAVQLLISMMRNGAVKPELRVQCANTIIDRVYGKPQQSVELDSMSTPQIIFVGGDRIAE